MATLRTTERMMVNIICVGSLCKIMVVMSLNTSQILHRSALDRLRYEQTIEHLSDDRHRDT